VRVTVSSNKELIMRNYKHLAAGVASLCLAAAAFAQQPIIYPSKGQTPQQQSKDDGECYVWAKQNTGIDPAVVAQTPAQTQPSSGGNERVQGALRGALGGAAIGAIVGDAGKGAGVGAVLGTMGGGRQARENQAKSQAQSQTQHQQTMQTFYRAYGACMQGRGYTVN
jgi:uncharacterized protein YcfJ